MEKTYSCQLKTQKTRILFHSCVSTMDSASSGVCQLKMKFQMKIKPLIWRAASEKKRASSKCKRRMGPTRISAKRICKASMRITSMAGSWMGSCRSRRNTLETALSMSTPTSARARRPNLSRICTAPAWSCSRNWTRSSTMTNATPTRRK